MTLWLPESSVVLRQVVSLRLRRVFQPELVIHCQQRI